MSVVLQDASSGRALPSAAAPQVVRGRGVGAPSLSPSLSSSSSSSTVAPSPFTPSSPPAHPEEGLSAAERSAAKSKSRLEGRPVSKEGPSRSPELYTPEILRLAASLSLADIPAPDGRGEARAKTCGSRIRTAVTLADGRITALSQVVQACAFGQASAALVQANAVGRSIEETVAARGELAAWLGGTRDAPPAWPGLSALAPARAKTARHGAMLLPFDALIAALGDAGA